MFGLLSSRIILFSMTLLFSIWLSLETLARTWSPLLAASTLDRCPVASEAIFLRWVGVVVPLLASFVPGVLVIILLPTAP